MIKSVSTFHKLSVCDGLEALATRNYNTAFPFHFHQTYNISLVYDGIFRTKVGEKTLHAPSGAILITNPLEVHSNPVEINERISYFTFYVSADFFNFSTSSQPVFFHNNVIYDELLFNRLRQVAILIENGGADDSIEQELSSALQSLASKYAFADGKNELVTNHSMFKDLLANENLDKFSLDQTAKQFGINKYKFLRLFKFQTGLTPNNYFILKRIEKSKELLSAGDDLLSIAVDLGFYDIPHFAKHFKKFTGISPAAYSSAITSAE